MKKTTKFGQKFDRSRSLGVETTFQSTVMYRTSSTNASSTKIHFLDVVFFYVDTWRYRAKVFLYLIKWNFCFIKINIYWLQLFELLWEISSSIEYFKRFVKKLDMIFVCSLAHVSQGSEKKFLRFAPISIFRQKSRAIRWAFGFFKKVNYFKTVPTIVKLLKSTLKVLYVITLYARKNQTDTIFVYQIKNNSCPIDPSGLNID